MGSADHVVMSCQSRGDLSVVRQKGDYWKLTQFNIVGVQIVFLAEISLELHLFIYTSYLNIIGDSPDHECCSGPSEHDMT